MSNTNTVSPLRLRMIEDMAGRKLNPHTQRGHIYSCKRDVGETEQRGPLDTLKADDFDREFHGNVPPRGGRCAEHHGGA